jgi:hypothetical protein
MLLRCSLIESRILVAAALAAAALCCAVGRPVRADEPAPADAASFSGLWETTYGRMRLVQTGEHVAGTYSYASGSALEGTVAGGRATLRYREPQAEGEAQFDLAADGESFTGRWRATGEESWSDWMGTRVHPVADRRYLVVLEARWEGSLTEQEYAFGDMLRTFFARVPSVEVRTRAFHDEPDFIRWCQELAWLAEPVVLVVASHGTADGISVGGATIGPDAIAAGLRHAGSLELLHFSACGLMEHDAAERIDGALQGGPRFPISGYASTVDWSASAVIEFLYLDLVLARGYSPAEAAEQVRKLVPLAGEENIEGAAIPAARFRLRLPTMAPANAPTAPLPSREDIDGAAAEEEQPPAEVTAQ